MNDRDDMKMNGGMDEDLTRTQVIASLTDGDDGTPLPEIKETEKKPAEKETSALREVYEFFRDLVVCALAVFLFTHFIARPVQVDGNSMYPTLHDTALGFSNVIGYKMNGIERFDVVIIYIENGDKYLVKRCVGLPGETISYTDGQLYVNGEAVAEEFFDEEYIAEFESAGQRFMSDVQPITLGENEYYCLGDNRPRSTDSRFYGPFDISQISSKGVFVFWPFSQIGGQAW